MKEYGLSKVYVAKLEKVIKNQRLCIIIIIIIIIINFS